MGCRPGGGERMTNGAARQRATDYALAVAHYVGPAVAYYVSAYFGFLLRFPGSPLSIIWPPNAILLVALLLVPTRRWWLVLLAVLPAHVLVNVQTGVGLSTTLGWYVTNCAEAVLAA